MLDLFEGTMKQVQERVRALQAQGYDVADVRLTSAGFKDLPDARRMTVPYYGAVIYYQRGGH